MPFMCECRGPCRRAIDIRPDVYRELRLMGAVLSPECAAREDRFVVYEYDERTVVALSTGPYVAPPHPADSLQSRP